LPLGAIANALVRSSLPVVIEGLQEQVGPLDHPLPLYPVGLLVVLEPTGQRTSGQRFLA